VVVVVVVWAAAVVVWVPVVVAAVVMGMVDFGLLQLHSRLLQQQEYV
jgi:hypothetical protein